MGGATCWALLGALLAAPGGGGPAAGPEPQRFALRCSRVLTADPHDRVFAPGVVLIEDGRVTGVGDPSLVPPGWEVRERDGWATPGLVDLHTHVHGGGFGDINDMVLPINADLRASVALVPDNPALQRARAAGVTTMFGIPGSGTSLGGFGVLYKPRRSLRFATSVLRDPGGMKVAQTHNPERRGGDLGATRSGLYWLLREVNQRARRLLATGGRDPGLENLARVHAGDLPVLVHCAGGLGVASTVRMWKGEFDTRCVVSHGSFDGWKVARYVAEMGVPVNHGPRTLDFFPTRDGRVVGTSAAYVEAGVPQFSLNTDSGVIPQEEFFLQGSMSARYGADPYAMLRAVTIHPAQAFGIDDRVGSLEAGKDADVVVFDGDPLDPRTRVELVLIEGVAEYDRDRDGPDF